MVVEHLALQGENDWVTNKYVQSLTINNDQFILTQPQTFMNNSGEAVKLSLAFYSLSPANLIVVHDDLDIPLGQYKIQLGKGPKVHNGISSIETVLGNYQFWRVRVGIDNRDPENRIPGDVYVLQQFKEEELQALDNLLPKITHDIMNLTNEQ